MATPRLSVNKLVKEFQFSCEENIHDDLLNSKNLLEKTKTVFCDEDEMLMTVESVKIWFGLQDLSHDFDGILQKSLLEPVQPRTSKFQRLLTTCFANFNPSSSRFDSTMMFKIKESIVRFQDIVTKIDRMGLNENSGRLRIPSTSLVNVDKVYGREKDKEEIVKLLLRPRDDFRSSDNGISVIPITGRCGVGKTTLAQLIYNDVRVQDRFDLKVWVCVSKNFDFIKVTTTILRSLGDHPIEYDDFNLLQEKLKKKLLGKKFLFVLDDMPNENYNDWTAFSCPFEAGTPGSKIIITTRNQGVVETMGTVPPYPVKELTNHDCLRVLAQHSLGKRDFSMHPSLKEIGEKIVIKCNGLPLIATTLGGHLRGKYDPSDWENVLNDKW